MLILLNVQLKYLFKYTQGHFTSHAGHSVFFSEALQVAPGKTAFLPSFPVWRWSGAHLWPSMQNRARKTPGAGCFHARGFSCWPVFPARGRGPGAWWPSKIIFFRSCSLITTLQGHFYSDYFVGGLWAHLTTIYSRFFFILLLYRDKSAINR